MVFPPPGIARQDWKIVRALGEFVGVTLPYSDDEEMEERVQTLVPLTIHMDELSHSQVRSAVSLCKIAGKRIVCQAKAVSNTVRGRFIMTHKDLR